MPVWSQSTVTMVFIVSDSSDGLEHSPLAVFHTLAEVDIYIHYAKNMMKEICAYKPKQFWITECNVDDENLPTTKPTWKRDWATCDEKNVLDLGRPTTPLYIAIESEVILGIYWTYKKAVAALSSRRSPWRMIVSVTEFTNEFFGFEGITNSSGSAWFTRHGVTAPCL